MSSAKVNRNATVIYLVRHGETTWNRVGRQQGHDDSPLTETGIEQARAAGRVLQRAIPDIHSVCIETSPLGGHARRPSSSAKSWDSIPARSW